MRNRGTDRGNDKDQLHESNTTHVTANAAPTTSFALLQLYPKATGGSPSWQPCYIHYKEPPSSSSA